MHGSDDTGRAEHDAEGIARVEHETKGVAGTLKFRLEM